MTFLGQLENIHCKLDKFVQFPDSIFITLKYIQNLSNIIAIWPMISEISGSAIS